MPSSKGTPTDPKLREEAKKEVMNQEKGGGKGNWSAYKAAEMAKVYEAKGGDYKDDGDNPNESSKGAPKPKKSAVDSGERKDPDAPVGEPKKKAADKKSASGANGKAKSSTSKAKTTPKAKAEPRKGERSQPKRSAKK